MFIENSSYLILVRNNFLAGKSIIRVDLTVEITYYKRKAQSLRLLPHKDWKTNAAMIL